MKNLTGILALLIMIFVGLACSGDDTEKANELVKEANKAVVAANESVVKAAEKYAEYKKKADSIKNDADLSAARDFGKDLFPLYDAMKENFQKAGDKFNEASKLNLNAKQKEYYETKGNEMKKRAEYSAELKKIPQALIDSTSEKDYKENKDNFNKNVEKMLSDAKDLGDKAEKIQKDNADIIKQPS